MRFHLTFPVWLPQQTKFDIREGGVCLKLNTPCEAVQAAAILLHLDRRGHYGDPQSLLAADYDLALWTSVCRLQDGCLDF
jgi:hypothetical protein